MRVPKGRTNGEGITIERAIRFDRIMNRLRAHHQSNYYVIGIDGFGGSGKTTYANKLKQYFIGKGYDVHLFHLDNFIHPNNIRYDRLKREEICYYKIQWRYDYLIEQILEPITNGQEIQKEIELYEKDTDTYAHVQMDIRPPAIVILEGVFLQRTTLRKYMNDVVFIDVPKEERLKRVLQRDSYIGGKTSILEKYNTRYFPAEDMYETMYKPKERADFIVK